MAPIEWKAEFSVGDAAVDHEHRQLVDLVNAAVATILENRPQTELDGCLGDLLCAVSAHFAHEELQMRRAHYDQLGSHKADHERLLDSLRDIMDGAHDGAPVTAARLTSVLETWFTDHFRSHDARLHRRLGGHPH